MDSAERKKADMQNEMATDSGRQRVGNAYVLLQLVLLNPNEKLLVLSPTASLSQAEMKTLQQALENIRDWFHPVTGLR